MLAVNAGLFFQKNVDAHIIVDSFINTRLNILSTICFIIATGFFILCLISFSGAIKTYDRRKKNASKPVPPE
jgi:hypothetical protein